MSPTVRKLDKLVLRKEDATAPTVLPQPKPEETPSNEYGDGQLEDAKGAAVPENDPKTPNSGQVKRRARLLQERNVLKEVKSPRRLGERTNSLQMTPVPHPRANRATEGAIICQSWDAEPYYRRAAKQLGWQQVPQQKESKQPFHIRFNVGDLEGAATDLKPNQLYNHFPCNRELTTKAGLCKNLWFNCFEEQEHRISHIFPRCYDLSTDKQIK